MLLTVAEGGLALGTSPESLLSTCSPLLVAMKIWRQHSNVNAYGSKHNTHTQSRSTSHFHTIIRAIVIRLIRLKYIRDVSYDAEV